MIHGLLYNVTKLAVLARFFNMRALLVRMKYGKMNNGKMHGQLGGEIRVYGQYFQYRSGRGVVSRGFFAEIDSYEVIVNEWCTVSTLTALS